MPPSTEDVGSDGGGGGGDVGEADADAAAPGGGGEGCPVPPSDPSCMERKYLVAATLSCSRSSAVCRLKSVDNIRVISIVTRPWFFRECQIYGIDFIQYCYFI